MEIVAHRGLWRVQEEKNTYDAIINAFKKGYGVETDLRDKNGDIVISHNIPNGDELCFDEILKYYSENKCNYTLALNIKADGLQELLENKIQKYSITNYFLFDMSIPEMVENSKKHLKFYTRYSDIEKDCILYDKANGIWLDGFFENNWFKIEDIEKHFQNNKKVCIVSSELHQRDYHEMWNLLKNMNIYKSNLLLLCTDKPDEAKEYFYE